MEWGVTYQDNSTILNPQGRIDSVTAKPFEDVVLAEIQKGARHLVVNFEKIDYINSAGLRVLLIAAKNLKSHQGLFSVCAMSDKIREVFEVSGFSKIIEIYPSLQESLKKSSPNPSGSA